MLRALGVVIVASLSIAACSDTEVVSKEPLRMVLKADSASDMVEAKDRANDYCKHFNTRAELVRTEAVDDEVIAYFDCR